ncbi:MAG: trypsin-like cysteine/serine peptidase domain-containing protein [Monoraphidium minutum]|nr:MAG: trypsin-like cysteine/serine peptidase domain-containing protein [Monoraphidium minutum]
MGGSRGGRAPARLLLAAAAALLLAASAAAFNTVPGGPEAEGFPPPVPPFELTPRGEERVTGAVVGGADAPQRRFPYHAYFAFYMNNPATGIPGWYFCGASLIRDDVAITAGHCLMNSDFEVAMRGYLYTGVYESPYWYPDNGTFYINNGLLLKRNFLVYDGYDGGFQNDIGLIFSDKCMTNGSRVTTIDIASKTEYAAATRNTYLTPGFGTTSFGANQFGQSGVFPQVMQVAQLGYVKPKVCAALFDTYSVPYNKDTMICAGGYLAEPGNPVNPPLQAGCQGDSGGSLVFTKDRQKKTDPLISSPADDKLVGVVSWGYGCGLNKAPGIYANVLTFRKWINQQLDANKKACAPVAEPTCKRTSSTQNYYQFPDITVPVDKKDAYKLCCAECQARAKANGGCKAFSVNSWINGRRLQASQPAEKAAALASTCTTCDADCDIYTGQVPTRICKPGEKLEPGTFVPCGVPSKGSARVVWKY